MATLMGWFGRRFRRPRYGLNARTMLPALLGAGTGAGVMYLLDPERGRRRRAVTRDRAIHGAHRAADLLGKGSRELRYRARGLVAEAQSRLKQEPVSDEQLVERVRSKMGRAVSHPHPIEVSAQGGCVTLAGAILSDEVDGLLSSVRSVPGVRDIDDQLEVHRGRDIPSLQGEGRRPGNRSRIRRDVWSPLLRIGACAMGAGIVATGLRAGGLSGATLGAAGALLFSRGYSNKPVKRLLGVGTGRRAVDFQKTIHIDAPLEEVFDFWANPENFPHFMQHVKEVEPRGDRRYHWVVEGPAKVPVSFDAAVTQFEPNETIGWASVPGSVIKNAGIVRFNRNGDGSTRIDVRMTYNPPAGSIGHAVASFFRADPKHAMDEDLVRLQSLLERGKTSKHGEHVTLEQLAGLRGRSPQGMPS